MLEEDLKPVIKPQYVDMIRKKVQGNVGEYIGKRDVVKKSELLKYDLELEKLYERNIEDLSGGELQRLALMIAMIQETEVYMFDEPTSYLDVKQRIKMAKLVRRLQTLTN